ncbi:MAG: hypothetical protein ACI90V_008238, partial [Bacillariaceae sp.]
HPMINDPKRTIVGDIIHLNNNHIKKVVYLFDNSQEAKSQQEHLLNTSVRTAVSYYCPCLHCC